MSTKIALTKNQVDHVIGLYSSGSIQEAIEEINSLNILYPNVPLLFNILGACYKQLGQLSDAEKMFKNAFSIKPDYAEAHFNYGIVQKDLGRIDAAIESYQNAISILPNYPDAHNNLGLLLLQNQQITDAVEHFEWAVAYKPEFEVAHNNLGAALQELRKYDESINSYKKAVEINPAYAQAHNNLGISFQIIGDQNKSIEHYEKALSIKSDYAQVHQDLSALKLYKSNDPQIKTIENLLSDDKTTESDKVFLCFALAKAYDDIGNSKGLYECLDEGNRLRKKQLNYSIDNSVRLHSVIKKLFSSPKPISKKNVSKNLGSKRPIFILGMPRSGTTLVEQIIASHKEVYGAE